MRIELFSVLKKENGVALLLTIILTGTLLTIGIATLLMINAGLSDTYSLNDESKAMYLAETGVHEAIWYLENVNSSWAGDSPTEHAFGDGTYTISIAGAVVTAVGYVPDIANERAHKTIAVQYVSSGGGTDPDGQYGHANRALSITNSVGTETITFSTNEDATVKYTTVNDCNWGKITVRDYQQNKLINGAMMTETDNGNGTWSYSYTIDTNTDLGGAADWYYIQVETNTPKEKIFAYIVTGSPATPHYIKTYSDAGYTTESDEFPLDSTIYVEVYGDDGNPVSNDSKLKLYDYFDNKVVDEKPQNLAKQASNTYRFTVNLLDADDPLAAGWYYSLETEMKQGGTKLFKGTKQIKIVAAATITVTGQYTEEIRGLEITDGSSQKTNFSTGDSITINYTSPGSCDNAEVEVKDYADNEIFKEDMTTSDNGDGTCTYSYTFDDTDLSGDDYYYYKLDVDTPKGKPQGLFTLNSGIHYLKTYSDAAYTTETDEFKIDSTIYIEVFGDDGNPTVGDSKVKIIDYSDDKKVDTQPTTLTKEAANTYRMSINITSADPPFVENWWYSLEVEAKEGGTKHFKGRKQIKILPASAGSFSTTSWTEVY